MDFDHEKSFNRTARWMKVYFGIVFTLALAMMGGTTFAVYKVGVHFGIW